jgi:RNA polymerase sigma factor (TIGR02999 family)
MADDERDEGSHLTRSTDELFSLVYSELRRLASAKLRRESNQTLGATELVNEAYVRLIRGHQDDWADRSQFFAAAAVAMRRILVERARHRKALKSPPRPVASCSIAEFALLQPDNVLDVLAVDEALSKLAESYPRHAQLVQLRFFAGLTVVEAARVLGVSPTTADNDWAYAKTWLRLELSDR